MKKIIISGVNIDCAGPLSIMQDALRCLNDIFFEDYEIIAIVHNIKLYKNLSNIKFIEFKNIKKSWIKRLYFEYFYLNFLSKKLKPYLWISMHDISPLVSAEQQVVYCHNSSPFYKMTALEKRMDWKLTLFNLFYKYLYRINIKSNKYVIVQQDWLRKKFEKIYGIKNIIVAYPDIKIDRYIPVEENLTHSEGKFIFFFPSFPRVFKNFEIIGEAARYFADKYFNIEFVVTISGMENSYAKYLYKLYSKLPNMKFIGLLDRETVFEWYKKSTAMIFPSKLETWGLPITEFKAFKKPIFVSNLEYAKETVQDYDQVAFFDPYDTNDLIEKLEMFLCKEINFQITEKNIISEPFTESWRELFDVILA